MQGSYRPQPGRGIGLLHCSGCLVPVHDVSLT
jgi:hypothetical protein